MKFNREKLLTEFYRKFPLRGEEKLEARAWLEYFLNLSTDYNNLVGMILEQQSDIGRRDWNRRRQYQEFQFLLKHVGDQWVAHLCRQAALLDPT